jgi:DNA N-6-adenine-methyltransferase (Dam)
MNITQSVEVINRVIEFYGGVIDLDPCSNSVDNPSVPAEFHYTVKLDGLGLPWAGKVFVNPPYGRELSKWVNKTRSEYESGRAREILLLVPSRTDTQWFTSLNPYPRVYLVGRLKFLDASGVRQEPAPFGSVLFYLGSRIQEFEQHWKDWGRVELGQAKISTASFDKRAYQREYMRAKRAKRTEVDTLIQLFSTFNYKI